MNSSTQISITTNHPLYPNLKAYNEKNTKEFKLIPYGQELDPNLAVAIDLTLLTREEKWAHLTSMHRKNYKIISDLTCHHGKLFLEKLNNIVGALACTFISPTQSFEYSSNPNYQLFIEQFFAKHQLTAVPVKGPGLCFSYPRIISMIINEAYIANEEAVATKEAVDTAMLYGVNYPRGPFQLAKSFGAKNIVQVLEELQHTTGEIRYCPSGLLKKEAKC